MKLLEVDNLSVRSRSTTILDQVSFSVEEGQWLMIVGPNGAGKSTLVKAISQGVPYYGTVSYRGVDLKRYKPATLAQCIGVLSQTNCRGYSFSVEEVVRLGRYCHRSSIFANALTNDQSQVQQALALTGMLPHAQQSIMTLSGGELQRTYLAQVLAQDPGIMILDEPTSHLDLIYQRQTIDLISNWLQRRGRAVISVVHDLSLAATYGTDALLLDRGRVVAVGKTQEVLTPGNLRTVYSIDVYAWMHRLLSHWHEEGVTDGF